MAVLYGEQDPDLLAVCHALLNAEGPTADARLSLEATSLRAQQVSQPVSVGGVGACDHCGGRPAAEAGQAAAPRLKICSACKCAKYCSQACQRSAWRQHKRECGK
jgi:hypothetical protein